MSIQRNAAAVALVAGLVFTGGASLAQDAVATSPGAKAVAARQANFKQQGGAFGGLMKELQKETPDNAALLAGATKLKTLSAALPSWFPKGSGPEAGVPTAAKAEIWTDAAGFAAAAQKFQTEAAKLQDLATANDLAGLKLQIRAVGGTCKGCHDVYRAPDKK